MMEFVVSIIATKSGTRVVELTWSKAFITVALIVAATLVIVTRVKKSPRKT